MPKIIELNPGNKTLEDMEKSKEAAITALRQVFINDPEYAYGWHCNLAMSLYDSIPAGVKLTCGKDKMVKICNEAAHKFMMTAFTLEELPPVA